MCYWLHQSTNWACRFEVSWCGELPVSATICADRGLTIKQRISRTGLSISRSVGVVHKAAVNSTDRTFGDPEMFRDFLSRKATNEER
jgi:hypothetical protein